MSVAELIKYENWYDKEKIIYLLNDTLINSFNEDLYEINFNLYKKKGYKINFNNSTFNNLKSSIKINLKINVSYSWTDLNYPPRFDLIIMKNDNIFNEYSYGINDELNTNNIYLSLVLDVINNDTLKIFFKLDTEKNINIEILKNSYYIIKTL